MVPPVTRTTEVQPDNLRDEIVLVMRLTAIIAVAAMLTMTALRSIDDKDSTHGAALLEFQILVRDLPAPEQRIYRQMAEGLVEAERIRGQTKEWPSVDVLAAQAIPPFASDPLDKDGYTWRLLNDGVFFEYVGIPSASSSAPLFLMQLQEPDPGVPFISKPPVDQVHHELSDGTPIHASFWKKAHVRAREKPTVNLIAEGFTQILVSPMKN